MLIGDLTGFRAYAAARGNAAPTEATDAKAGEALQRASDYIRRFYVRHSPRQIPEEELTEATYIAAGRELTKPGFFSRSYTPGEAKVLTGAGKLSWTVIGDASAEGAMRPVDADIEDLLGSYVARGRGFGAVRSIGG